jgi:protein TonB
MAVRAVETRAAAGYLYLAALIPSAIAPASFLLISFISCNSPRDGLEFGRNCKYNDNNSHLCWWRIVTSWTYTQTDRGLSGSVGLIATIAVHLVVLLFLLSSRQPLQAQPAPISARVISDAWTEQAKPQRLRANPVFDQPKLNMPVPEIVLADNPPAPNSSAPVSVGSAAPSRAEPQQTVESMPRFDVDYLDNPAPRYPPLSRRMREEGVVLVRVYVLPNGAPEVVELKRSSGSVRLDESALLAVRQWKFVPAQRSGRSVGAWVVVPVAFSLTA